MPIVEYRSGMPVPPADLFAWHERPGALQRLTPPWVDARVVRQDAGLADGAIVTLSMPVGPIRREWVARHFDYDPPRQFCDEQVKGPFAKFVHCHRCLAGAGEADSALSDRIDYAPPLGALGRWLGGATIRGALDQTFWFRHGRTRRDLARHARFAPVGPLRVAVTGASGLIGRLLRPLLSGGGHRVNALVRRAADPAAGEIAWDPAAGTIDAAALEGVDAVVHLSGENVASGRWTAARKARFVSSRTVPTGVLCRALAGLARKPRVLVCASAVGFYGDRGDGPITEDSPKGVGFFPDLCEAWEAASAPAADAGIRVVHLRIGAVLSPRGGALQKMLTPAKWGVAGPVGSGRQYLSWIGSEDLVNVVHEAIFNDALVGPVNAVAPDPATNRQFINTLGAVLHRPTFLPLPAFAVSALFGEMGRTILLQGARVLPAKLQSVGFDFAHPTLESAFRAELGRQSLPAGWGDPTP